ncbi:MAG: RluA family pseudouridine synthase [Tissierellia bacterium]|nr:RluA family pseudouridine synthase [Bacillota bacterium]NLK57791.1 RluA family pseudouridine synthase [Tissierellia bacterium]
MIDTRAAREIRLKNREERPVKPEVLFAGEGLSRNSWMEAYRAGLLYADGQAIGRNTRIPAGKSLVVRIPDERSEYEAEPLALRILYEDAHLLVVDKEAGSPMLPVQGQTKGSLANGVQGYFDQTGTKRKIRFINRLDRDTSGIVLIAKHRFMQAKCQKQMADGTMEKGYLALVGGALDTGRHMHIVTPLQKETDGFRYVPDENGRASHTELTVLFSGALSLLSLQLHTGRTHQIRAHLSSIGFPILGDALYAGKQAERMYLHAWQYGFVNWNGRSIRLRCAPKDWAGALGMEERQFNAHLNT